MWGRVSILWQDIVPQHWLSSLMYQLTRCRWKPLKNFLISSFVKVYGVNLQLTDRQSPADYQHFNDFFTRALLPSVRPVDSDLTNLVSPVDGAISQIGSLDQNRLLQAKGVSYELQALLGGDHEDVENFTGGQFSTIYLSPKDYHRIHMPYHGVLAKMIYVPGALYSVNERTTNYLPGLFTRNERVICLFDTKIGPMAVILVGAIFVGSMETVWAGEITPNASRTLSITHYDDKNAPSLNKGDELGRFNMGSTVIVLLGRGQCQWQDGLKPGTAVEMGQVLGQLP